MSSFQQKVNNQPALGVAGDFASENPHFTVNAGPGGLVAGALGAVVGRFAWGVPPVDLDGSPMIVNSFGVGPVTGFVGRNQQGLITRYLDAASMVIAAGFQMFLYNGGDFLVVNDGATEALMGQKAYANLETGKVTFAPTGQPLAGGTSSASSIAAETFSVTGSIVDDVLEVTAVGSGTIEPGSTISGAGIASGTQVLSQQSGTPGGIGNYLVSIPEQNVASTTVSGTYGLLTVGGTVTGTFGVDDVLAATGSVVAGTTIRAPGTGVGGAGTYIVDNNTVVSSQAINVGAINVETKWVAMSANVPGGIVKISDHLLG